MYLKYAELKNSMLNLLNEPKREYDLDTMENELIDDWKEILDYIPT